MREALTLAAVLAAACALGRREEAAVTPGVSLAAYRRVGVVPFADQRGLGRAYGPALSRALHAIGFDVAPDEAMAANLRGLGVRPGEPLGAPTLRELRQSARVQAVAYGTLECPVASGERRVSVLLVDTARGDAVFRISFKVESCGTPADAEAAAQRAAARLRRALGPEGRRFNDLEP